MTLENGQEASLHLLFASPFTRVDEKLAEGAGDHAQVGPGGAPSLAGQMLHTDLSIGVASAFQPVEQFGVDHRAARFERVLMQDAGAQELESTVDVAHVDIQYQADQALPAPGVELAHPRILAV